MTHRTQKPGDDTPDGYRDFVPLRRGPAGALYRAHSERLGRPVAVKAASATVSGSVGRRFVREAQELGPLTQCPDIAAPLDAGLTERGRPYVVREFFDEGSVADLLQSTGPLPLTDVLHIGVLMATALGTAHAQGILHQSVRPQNIMRTPTGFALADFTIPALAQAPTTGEVPVHCAPERLRGGAATVAADVYSLGSTLFELLAARPPYQPDGGVASLLLRMLNDEPPRLVRADVPPAVAAVVTRAMAREAEGRYGDAFAIAADLQRVQTELGLAVTRAAGSAAGAVAAPGFAGAGAQGAESQAALTGSADAAWAPASPEGAAPEFAGPAAQIWPTVNGPAPNQAPEPAGVAAGLGAPVVPPPAAAMARVHPRPPKRTAHRWPAALGIGAVALAAVGSPLLLSGRSAAHSQGGTAPAAGRPSVPTDVANAPAPTAGPAAAAPAALVAGDAGTSVNLRWTLPPGSELYPVLVQVTSAAGRQDAPVPLPADTRTYVATGLDRVAGYCFQAGLLLRFGDANHSPVEVWSTPACVRGAVGTPHS